MTELLKSATKSERKGDLFLFEAINSTKNLHCLCGSYTNTENMHISDRKLHLGQNSPENQTQSFPSSQAGLTEAAGLPPIHQFCFYIYRSQNKSKQVQSKATQIKPDITSSSCTMEAKRQERGIKHTRENKYSELKYSHFFSVNWWSKQDFPTPMSPVTERIVKADTTSLLWKAHFLHPTQGMVQRRADPSLGLAHDVCTWSQSLNSSTFAVVLVTGLQARVERTTRGQFNPNYWFYNCISQGYEKQTCTKLKCKIHLLSDYHAPISLAIASQDIRNTDNQPEYTKKLLHFHLSTCPTPTGRKSKIC